MNQLNNEITKYPIILVHGVMIKDFKFFKAFGRIERTLKENGYKVYTAPIDALGISETNAIQLKEFILKILKEEEVEKVNIIAHSKGGLDAKYMIMNLDMEDKVASLTSLCTPFKGSPIASFLLKWPKWILSIINFFINLFYKIFGDKYPNGIKVCEELKRIDTFEDELLNFSPKVYSQSYSSKIIKAKDDFIMSIPLTFSKYFEKENITDGLVPEDSTHFGEYKGEAIKDTNISHTEIVDFMVKQSKKSKIYAFYLSLAKDLAFRGY